MTERTLLDACNDIAEELHRQGIVIRNRVTGRTVHTGQDIFDFSSHGELFHIHEWWEIFLPGVDMQTGKLKGPIRETSLVLGTMEGEQTESDKRLGVIITYKHRLEIFNAQLMQVFKMAMEARGMPIDDTFQTLPTPPSAPTKTAPVISIVSGKRRRRKKKPTNG